MNFISGQGWKRVEVYLKPNIYIHDVLITYTDTFTLHNCYFRNFSDEILMHLWASTPLRLIHYGLALYSGRTKFNSRSRHGLI
jgi:hypothetical protein